MAKSTSWLSTTKEMSAWSNNRVHGWLYWQAIPSYVNVNNRREIDIVLTFSPSWHFSWGTFTYMTPLINVGQNTNTIVDPAYMIHFFQHSQCNYSAWKIHKRQESLSAPCSLPLCRVALDYRRCNSTHVVHPPLFFAISSNELSFSVPIILSSFVDAYF